MLALGIDTSTPMVSVTVVGGEGVVARRGLLVHNGHGEVLAGLVDEVLHDARRPARDLRAVGVGLGPGPFTGLRVGIVTAAAISDALEIPAYGMCSLDTIHDVTADNAPYAVVTDARRRQVYWAVYDAGGRRTEGPEISAPDELAVHLRGRIGRITGAAAPQQVGVFTDFVVTESRWPDAGEAAMHALECASRAEPPGPLTPLYLRRPDAREPGPPKRVTPA
jgi:tRNA threonylcarbamoyl adenosine modification protein YeaZ